MILPANSIQQSPHGFRSSASGSPFHSSVSVNVSDEGLCFEEERPASLAYSWASVSNWLLEHGPGAAGPYPMPSLRGQSTWSLPLPVEGTETASWHEISLKFSWNRHHLCTLPLLKEYDCSPFSEKVPTDLENNRLQSQFIISNFTRERETYY